MSLQYYDITLAATESKEFAAQGRYVYYLTGTTPLITGGVTPAAAGNQAIRIKPGQGGGGEIILMPGQSMRLPDDDKAPVAWRIANYKQAEAITGTVLIGEGEFVDNNTTNTFKLDATFANNVKVTNDTSNRVPVSLDTSQTLNLASTVMAYTTAHTSSAASVANTAITMLTPGTNVNGVLLNKFELLAAPSAIGAGMGFTVIAKASAPANMTDGDVLFSAVLQPSVTQKCALDVGKDGTVRVPPGKGIYFISNAVDGCVVRDALFTVL